MLSESLFSLRVIEPRKSEGQSKMDTHPLFVDSDDCALRHMLTSCIVSH